MSGESHGGNCHRIRLCWVLRQETYRWEFTVFLFLGARMTAQGNDILPMKPTFCCFSPGDFQRAGERPGSSSRLCRVLESRGSRPTELCHCGGLDVHLTIRLRISHIPQTPCLDCRTQRSPIRYVSHSDSCCYHGGYCAGSTGRRLGSSGALRPAIHRPCPLCPV